MAQRVLRVVFFRLAARYFLRRVPQMSKISWPGVWGVVWGEGVEGEGDDGEGKYWDTDEEGDGVEGDGDGMVAGAK